MKHKIIGTFSLVALFWTFSVQAQNLNQDELSEKIESLIPAEVNDKTPGLVIGVVHKGEMVFSKGYGMANLSYQIPNDPKMIYNIGSVSKQFLGYAFAMLHTDGKLNINDPVGKYLKDWPEFEHTVTIRNLLTHTSGYREAYTMSSLAGRPVGVDRLTKEECLNVVRRQPKLEFTPGSRYTYNSTAWVILAEILEEVVDEPAEKWVTENILLPLEMKNTRIESYVGEVLPNAAESYREHRSNGYVNPKSNRAIFGGAEVFSSIEDLAKWLDNFRTLKVGSREVMDLFLSPFQLSNGTNSQYALGIEVRENDGVIQYGHNGGHEAFITQLLYYPEHDLGLVTISNFGGSGVLPLGEVADYILKDHMKTKEVTYPTFEMSKSDLRQFEGIYLATTCNDELTLKMEKDSLMVWGTRLRPISSHSFYIKEWDEKFEFTPTENGLQLKMDGSRTIHTKVEPWEASEMELEDYAGDYWSEELETVYHLAIKEGQLVVTHRWLGEINLNPIAKDVFKSDWGWFLQVERDKMNKVKGFNINSGRTLNVYFQRKP